MDVKNYISARTNYLTTSEKIAKLSGPLSLADDAALRCAATGEHDALLGIASAPTNTLSEIAERASLLFWLIDDDAWEGTWAQLASRIAEDLRALSRSGVR